MFKVLQRTQPFGKKLDDLTSECLQFISANDALVFFCASHQSSCASSGSSSRAGHTLLSDINNSLRLTLSNIINVNITDEQWRQASFPVTAGDIGFRSVMSIVLSAFLSLSTSTQQLQALLLGKCTWQLSDQHFDNIMDDWC